MRPILVGEDNPYGSDPRYALYFEPEHSAGGRLCRLVLGLSGKDYIRGFERLNLCGSRWSNEEARKSADAIMARAQDAKSTIVLLGAKVTRAFQFNYAPFTKLDYLDKVRVVFLPHPSGRNRVWNEPGAFARARHLLHEAGVLPVPSHVPLPREEMPRTATTTERPALCSNCGILVEGEHCPDCGPMVR